MAPTLKAEVKAGDPPYVLLTATIDGGPWATASISRYGAGAPVEIWYSTKVTALELLDDRQAPFGLPITYKLTLTPKTGAPVVVESNAVQVDTIGCWLSDQATGLVGRVEVQDWPERTRAARRAILEVLGRPDPIAVHDVHTWPAGTATFLTRDPGSLDLLIRILTGSGVVLLRTQAASSLVTVYASVGDITERRISVSGQDWRRLVDVDIQEVAPLPAGARVSVPTLQVLHDKVPTTLDDIHGRWKTLLEIPAGLL